MASTHLTLSRRIVVALISGALLLGAAPTTPAAVAAPPKAKDTSVDSTFSGDGRKNK